MNSPAALCASSPISFDAPISATFSQLMISLPADEHDYLNEMVDDAKPATHHHYAPYPVNTAKSASSPKQPRRRRKRETIDIPEELVHQYDPQEIKKIKNRIAAARLRERSQQKIRDLEAEVIALRERNAFLESRMTACFCNGSSPVQTVDASTSTAPSAPNSPKSQPGSPTPSVRSPSSISDGAAMTQNQVMTEFESDLLQQLLWQSEELTAMQMQL